MPSPAKAIDRAFESGTDVRWRVIVLTEEELFGASLQTHLERAGVRPRVRTVESLAELRARLADERPDAIVIDHRAPSFFAAEAHVLTHFRGPVVAVGVPGSMGRVHERVDAALIPADLDRLGVEIAGALERWAQHHELERLRAVEREARRDIELVPATEADPDVARSLRAARRRNELLVRMLPGVTFILLHDRASGRPGRFMWLSPNATELLGGSVDAMLADATPFLERIPDRERQAFVRALNRGVEKGEAWQFEHRLRSPTGEVRLVRHYATPVVDRTRDREATYGIMLDVTDEVNARERTELLGRVLEQAANMVIITAADGTIEYVNPAFESTTGYSRREAIGANPRILQGGLRSKEYYEEMWTSLRAGEPWETVFDNQRKDGTRYRQKSTISPVADRYGVVRYVGTAQDVSHVSQMADRLNEYEVWFETIRWLSEVCGDLAMVTETTAEALDELEQVLSTHGGQAPITEAFERLRRSLRREHELIRTTRGQLQQSQPDEGPPACGTR